MTMTQKIQKGSKNSLSTDARLIRLTEVMDGLKDTLMPDRHKALTIWVRLKTADFGMSMLNLRVHSATISGLCTKMETALVRKVNEIHGTEFTEFDEIVSFAERVDTAQIRDELEQRFKDLNKEFNDVKLRLERLKKRDRLANRRNKLISENPEVND